MRHDKKQRRNRAVKSNRRSYELVLRGPDGRPRFERFASAAAYRARLASLQHFEYGSLSIDELAGLLDG